MGYLRKALSITTLGLSNLVLDDDSKPAVSTTKARPRPRKRSGSKATAKAKSARTKAGAARTASEHKTSPPKSRSARAKPKASAAKRPSRTATAKAKPRSTARAKAAAPQPKAEAQPKVEAAAPAVARPGAPISGVAIALDRLAKLHMNGALTDREFAAAKARILGTGALPDQPERSSAAFPAIEANVAAARRLAGYSNPSREPSAPTPGASRGI